MTTMVAMMATTTNDGDDDDGVDDGDVDEDGLSPDGARSVAVAKTHDGDDTGERGGKDAKPDDEKTAEVVSLDTFRKRPTN